MTTETYYPKPIPVRAERATERMTWVTKYGDEMTAEVGDYVLSDAKKSWSVKPDIFERTYRECGEGMWTKCVPVQIEIAEVEQRIATLEGEQTVPAGWAIVHGIDGERYSMSPERLAERYTQEVSA